MRPPGWIPPEERTPEDLDRALEASREAVASYAKEAKKKPAPPHQPIKSELNLASTYVVTYAQNATPVHEAFLRTLEGYCQINEATLVVIPGRYKNPTSIWSSKMSSDEWWDEQLHPYLYNGRLTLGENVTIYGDISIQPTASRPLNGFEVFVGKYSAVFGHPRLQLKTVATASRHYPRLLTTTGAITEPNYTDSKAGKKGHAHHMMGATVIEHNANGTFHIRQISACEDGSFIDLDTEYKTTRLPSIEGSWNTDPWLTTSFEAPPALALVMGDIHVAHSDKAILDASLYAEDSIARTLRPERIVLHDVLDFDTRNHHSMGSFVDRYGRVTGRDNDCVKVEVTEACQFLDSVAALGEVVVIASNHDEAFDRWLRGAEPKVDPKNAKFFYDTWAMLLEEYEIDGKWTPAFELWYKNGLGTVYDMPGIGPKNAVRFIHRDEEFRVKDIFLNFHGDYGTNGSKGSPMVFAKLGIKTIIGHGHSPTILDECFAGGVTGALNQGYNHTPSSWLHSHTAVYANGMRAIINVIHNNEGTASWRK